jgi:hypothetical protein
VDDIILIIKNSDEVSTTNLIDESLKEFGLHKSKEKSGCVPISSDINYLGYLLRLPMVTIKDTTVERFIRSLSSIFSMYAKQGPKGMYPRVDANIGKQLFISDVNEKITGAISEKKRFGWLSYFLEINDLPLLFGLDLLIRNKFFNRLTDSGTCPNLSEIKKLSRTYYEAKYHPLGGYLHNYDIYDSPAKKIRFLTFRGIIKEEDGNTLSVRDIEILFNQFKNQRLSDLEADVGKTS